MAWELALSNAAERFDGGRRSFPPSADATFARLAYDAPNEDYQKLFWRQATVSHSQHDSLFHPHSAGWLIPDEDSVCKPVFVAHSVLSAIWLLRDTLGDGALGSAGWESLVDAAYELADGRAAEPLSAQKPPASLAVDSRKRPASSAAHTPASKHARTDAHVSSPAPSSRHSPPPSSPALSSLHSEPPATPVHMTTVTNNNRRAELRREKKREAAVEKKRLEMGLVAPHLTAPRSEQSAYHSITPQDEPTVAWIIKQPGPSESADFYHAVKAPYVRACEFLAKARSLGNPSSQAHAAKFLQAWRKRGSLFGAGRAAHAPPLAMTDSTQDSVNSVFRSAWERCNQYDEIIKSVHIEYRWAQALLGQAYANKIAQIQEKKPTAVVNHTGRCVVRTEAIDTLFALLDTDASKDPRKQREAFRARLNIATRWYNVAQALGWGIFIVMSEDFISHTWIEYTIRSWGVPVFVDLVKKERPDVCAAAKAFDDWLGPEGIAGGPLGGRKTLAIELDAPPSTADAYQVLDTDSDEEDLAGTQTHLLQGSPAVHQRTSLLELFHTVN